MEKAGDMPDIIVAPFGGGSNFAGLTFPFLRLNLGAGKEDPLHRQRTGILSQTNARCVPL
jgi:predicted alternative tryptophan synthase beta-subunit